MNTNYLAASATRRIRVGLKNTALCTVSATAILLSAANATHAQEQLAAASPAPVEEIVVTGTRIVRDGFEAPTPVSVVGVEEILTSASSNPADFVSSLPTFSNSLASASLDGDVQQQTPRPSDQLMKERSNTRSLPLEAMSTSRQPLRS